MHALVYFTSLYICVQDMQSIISLHLDQFVPYHTIMVHLAKRILAHEQRLNQPKATSEFQVEDTNNLSFTTAPRTTPAASVTNINSNSP